MGLYEVVKVPLSYANEDGSATLHRRTGTLLEMDDEKAAELGEALRLLGVEPRYAEGEEAPQGGDADGTPVTFVETGETVTEPAETVTAPAETATEDPETDTTKPRRGRTKADADGQD